MSERIEAVQRALEPALARRGYELFDVTLTGQGRARILRVAIDRDAIEGERGIDLEAITDATEAVSEVLDHDESLMAGPYTLEVSSPGVERPLRRPSHYRRAVGETVTVKTRDPEGGAERVRGVLVDADETADGGVTLRIDDHEDRVAYGAIESARTVFEWGPTPAPGRAGKNTKRNRPRREEALPRRAEAAEERQSR
jgi:ribosome maturation factor RimP